VLRRNAGDSEVQELRLKDVEVNFQSRHVTVRGRKVHLTPKEFELLQYFVNNANKIVPHREMLRAVWGPDYGNEFGHLRAYMKQLREKIELQPGKPKYLLTEPWAGYQLRGPE
jgi:two-component system KDP operon response regulator KdpE